PVIETDPPEKPQGKALLESPRRKSNSSDPAEATEVLGTPKRKLTKTEGTPAKRIYYSPSTPSTKTPTKDSDKIDMTGYITNVTEIVTSRKSGNDYFDVYLKTSPTVQEVIRVMIKHNRSIKRSFFSEAKEIPVKITNLTKRDNVSFFNSNFNSSSLVKTHLTTSFDFAADNLFSSIDHVNTFEKGTFNIKGAFIWSSAETKAKKKDGSMERVRDGVIVQREDSTISVSVWGKLIGKNFELQDKQTIEDKILELSDCVKITYSKSKLVVTNILEVEEEDDLI
uniref:Uncharacterized protein n=1 Tax=Clytia hemisphaerica TaxID=252671 RepID=A0A7M5XLJ5_9CNID